MNTLRHIRYHVGALFLTLIFTATSTLNAEEDSNPTEDALLREILLQNSAAYRKASETDRFVSFSWNGEATEPDGTIPGGTFPAGRRRTEGNTRIWISGANYHQDLNLTHTWVDGTTTDASCIMVLNEQYFARYYKSIRLIELYRFHSRDTMYPLVRSMSERFPSPGDLKFGFMAGSSLLRDKYRVQASYPQPAFTWSVTREEGPERPRLIVRSERVESHGPTWLREESVIEPTKGYLVSEHRWYEPDGSVRSETRTELQQLPNGDWFPKSATVNKKLKSEEIEYTFHDARIGVAISRERFTIEAMEFDPTSVLMKEVPRDGSGSIMKSFYRGRWIPLDTLSDEQRSRLTNVKPTG